MVNSRGDGGQKIQRRFIRIVDESLTSIKLVVFSKCAEDLGQLIGQFISVQNGYVQIYQGVKTVLCGRSAVLTQYNKYRMLGCLLTGTATVNRPLGTFTPECGSHIGLHPFFFHLRRKNGLEIRGAQNSYADHFVYSRNETRQIKH